MRLFITGLVAALAFGAGTAASAATTGYVCKIRTNASQLGWIPKEVHVRHKSGDKTGMVADPIIMRFNNGKPLEANVSVNNDRRITFAWEIRTKSSTNQQAKIFYRATYQKGSSEMTVSAQPGGFPNSFNGIGTCEVKPL